METKDEFQAGLDAYAKHLFQNYVEWADRTNDSHVSTPREERFQVTFEQGRKFIRVVSINWGSRSAHTFIALEDDGKFKRGDILKAASWASPAKNFARGNILTGDWSKVTWTGA